MSNTAIQIKSDQTPGDIVKLLSAEVRKKLTDASSYLLSDKKQVLDLANRVLAELDDIDAELGNAVDFLQCQVEHKNAQDKVLEAIDYSHRFQGEFGDLRHELRRLIEPLMENLRYGKRTEELDRILHSLASLSTLANQSPTVQPIVNFSGIEGALSPRCHTCEASCRSAFRIISGFLRKIIRELQADNGPDAKTAGH
jgi:hypothetical protein